jgi:hypothetical protein
MSEHDKPTLLPWQIAEAMRKLDETAERLKATAIKPGGFFGIEAPPVPRWNRDGESLN